MNERLTDAIKVHRENKDYPEVVRDAILFLMNEIRAKSDLQDIDGEALINKAFSESKPYIKINKMQNSTEKNKQKGIMNLCKGLVEYFRNPMSHAKQNYSEDVANIVVTLVDKILLKEIESSKNTNSIEGWYSEIMSEACPKTGRYAEALVNNIPNNKRYELAVLLYKARKNITDDKMIFVEELEKRLSEEDFLEYCSNIESDIFGENSQTDIIEISKFISKKVWGKFNDLSKTKIEEMVLEDLKKCEVSVEYEYDYFIDMRCGYIVNALKDLIYMFSNKKDITKCLTEKLLVYSDNEKIFDYCMEIFSSILVLEEDIDEVLTNYITNRIEEYEKPHWYKNFMREVNLVKNKNWYYDLDELLKTEA